MHHTHVLIEYGSALTPYSLAVIGRDALGSLTQRQHWWWLGSGAADCSGTCFNRWWRLESVITLERGLEEREQDPAKKQHADEDSHLESILLPLPPVDCGAGSSSVSLGPL
uniref:Uncharacterized protein n=1 Tax=Knipowitschia caucasica TaxID=637954 RepID=A0AAV2L4S2_KNICA